MGVVVGITGGIATGKSTVREMFADLGAETASADIVARDVLAPGEPAALEVIREFGDDIADEMGVIDRRKLGERVFSAPGARKKLEELTHPEIIKKIRERIADFRFRRCAEPGAVLAVEIPLLYEVGLKNIVDAVVVVSAEQETAISRLMSRDDLSRDAAEARLSAQMPLADKVKMADFVIKTDAGLENTREQVVRIYQQVGECQ